MLTKTELKVLKAMTAKETWHIHEIVEIIKPGYRSKAGFWAMITGRIALWRAFVVMHQMQQLRLVYEHAITWRLTEQGLYYLKPHLPA